MTYRMFLGALIFVLLLLMITACSGQATSGTVTVKEYQAPYSYDDIMCAAYNTQGACSVYMPYTQHVPECFYIEFYNESQDDWGSRCVSPEQYATIVIGQEVTE